MFWPLMLDFLITYLKFPDDTDSITISATGSGMCIVNVSNYLY